MNRDLVFGSGSRLVFSFGMWRHRSLLGALAAIVEGDDVDYPTCVTYTRADTTLLLVWSRSCTILGNVFGLVGCICVWYYCLYREISKKIWFRSRN